MDRGRNEMKKLLKKEKLRYIQHIHNLTLFSNNNFTAWEVLEKKLKLFLYQKGETIIEQGGRDDSIFFILQGSVDIFVHKEYLTTKTAKDHVGEIVAAFPTMKRTATVQIAEETVLAKMSGNDFRLILKDNPQLYRQIAEVLAQQLEGRNESVSPRNDIPALFMGSSSESVKELRAIGTILSEQTYQIKHWKDAFEVSDTTIESLEKILQECDFAVFLITGDDKRYRRHKAEMIPRDNVIFEIGLAMGKLGRKRTIIVQYQKNGKKIYVPSDLENVQRISYSNRKQIIKLIKKYGCRKK